MEPGDPFQWGAPDNDSHELGRAAAEWLDERGCTVHGHTLIWNDDEHTLPDLVGEEDAEAIRQRLREHVREQMGALAGDVHEWDLINHPFWGNDIWVEHLDSDREDWVDWLATASEADPEAELFVNEEAMRDQPSVRENDRQYREMIEYLVERDAELDGAGFMGHFTPETLLAPGEVIEWLDRYEEYEIELQITEFDVAAGWHAEQVDGGVPDISDAEWRDVQSDYVRDFLTAVFSHPSTTAVIVWEFWEPEMWRPDGAFLTENFDLTPAGQAYVDLVYDEWWTEASGRTDDSGGVTVEGFKGEYEIEAEADGQT